ncbi:MarR family transcriptional regulator [Facklamia miroungae]|uniref:DNA-binding transcriptional regulator, MarR family n=1 Tax=Facklamia miroungae TaxID=120956 RepID=A0A1G7QA78_9LACT|nr:MarR family transcriptional regulator [Facklamia miroungae]NKZ28879.1 MarR family transcriptional regulator [Facklamia miroungae]SDF95497.1 DNA-binding transcriptional regulator, MarR family [Facklamia miroungae]
MIDSAKVGKYISKIALINGRLFHKILSLDDRAKFNSEQGKILYCLWEKAPLTTTDLSMESGLAKNTLSSMLNRMEKAGLIYSFPHPSDKRKRYFDLTEEGRKQSIVGEAASKKLSAIFYEGFTEEESKLFEALLERVVNNLEAGDQHF